LIKGTPYFLMAGAILLATVSYVGSQTFPGIISGGTVMGNNTSSGAMPGPTAAPILGLAGSSTGQLGFSGTTGGTVTLKPQAAAGTYNFNLPTTSGSSGQPLLSGGGGSSPQTYGTLGISGGGTNCSAASGTCLDNITGFSGTGFIQRTGAGTYTFGTSSSVAPVCGASGLSVANNAGTPSTRIDVAADQLAMVTATGTPIYRTAVAFTIDTTVGTVTSTANGMDGETRPTSGWLNIWAVDNGTAAAGLGATSASSPTLPSGYTYKCRLGAMFFDGSQNALRTKQLGSWTQYVVTTATNTPNYPRIATGAVGTIGTPTFVSESLTGFVPPTATEGRFILVANSASGSLQVLSPNNATAGTGSLTNPSLCAVSGNGSIVQDIHNTCSLVFETAQTVFYAAATSTSLFIAAWKDKVSAN
jgi:hypothetical protein